MVRKLGGAIGVLALGAAIGAGAWALAQEKQDGQKPGQGQPQMDPEMQACIEAGTPGEHHKMLDGMVGKWNTLGKFWMGPEVTESKGTSESKWIYDGRYIESEYHGDMGGMPFTGRGFTGYDNTKKKYFSTWIDSMSTGFFMAEGTYDAAKKQFTFTGEYTDPMGKPTRVKETVQIIDNNKHVFTYEESKGDAKGYTKVMEITYTRAGVSGADGHE